MFSQFTFSQRTEKKSEEDECPNHQHGFGNICALTALKESLQCGEADGAMEHFQAMLM